MGKIVNGHFFKDGVQIINKHMIKCITLPIKERKVKGTM